LQGLLSIYLAFEENFDNDFLGAYDENKIREVKRKWSGKTIQKCEKSLNLFPVLFRRKLIISGSDRISCGRRCSIVSSGLMAKIKMVL
jgi:hypothetical protein